MSCSRTYFRAHPRPCGEHAPLYSSMVTVPGSSPPVRGAHSSQDPAQRFSGLIPARAGSTNLRVRREASCRAHPRSRGEHTADGLAPLATLGSSPPVRGALKLFGFVLPCGGLIPARAGSTRRDRLHSGIWWAHPRPCGEHRRWWCPHSAARGSSPPVRGAQYGHGTIAPNVGLIPARAGSTTPCVCSAIPSRAHPRPCGEHTC